MNKTLTIFNSNSTLSTVIDSVMGILNSLIPLLIGAAIVVFLYGVLLFIAKTSVGNSEGRKEGINFMIFGIIGIAVMMSVWGLVYFVTNTLGTTGGIPQFNSNVQNGAESFGGNSANTQFNLGQ
jgi:hypothetical protein